MRELPNLVLADSHITKLLGNVFDDLAGRRQASPSKTIDKIN